jgi:hexosaminidase
MIKLVPKPVKAYFDPVKKLIAKKEETTQIDFSLPKEGYTINVDESGIRITGGSEKGVFYARETLRQISAQSGIGLPYCSIEDCPKYEYRGYMLDCSRHFFSVAEIKRQLFLMSLLKLNVFHWHLTDDQGWRIKIDAYPDLTKKSSMRSQTKGDKTPHGGYYSKAEIKEVVEYAAALHIDVLPEIDMPGHFSAAIHAYPFLSCKGEEVDVKTEFGIHPDIACMGKESTYKFIYEMLDEVMELFPFPYIHLGGDEAIKTHVIECKDCIAMIKENDLQDTEQLQAHFMARVEQYVLSKGKKAIIWNDGAKAKNSSPTLIVQHWQPGRASEQVTLAADERGCKIILSPFMYYYLDYPYGMTPLRKTYEYDLKLNEKEMNALWGVEAPLWTEYVADRARLEYMTYPRLLALAETGWLGAQDKDYEDFEERAAQFCLLLDKHGVNYAKIDTVNPGFIKGKRDMLRFFANAAGGNSIKRLIQNRKNAKKINKFNKSLKRPQMEG